MFNPFGAINRGVKSLVSKAPKPPGFGSLPKPPNPFGGGFHPPGLPGMPGPPPGMPGLPGMGGAHPGAPPPMGAPGAAMDGHLSGGMGDSGPMGMPQGDPSSPYPQSPNPMSMGQHLANQPDYSGALPDMSAIQAQSPDMMQAPGGQLPQFEGAQLPPGAEFGQPEEMFPDPYKQKALRDALGRMGGNMSGGSMSSDMSGRQF